MVKKSSASLALDIVESNIEDLEDVMDGPGTSRGLVGLSDRIEKARKALADLREVFKN